MKDEIRRLVMQQAKRDGNKSAVANKLDIAEKENRKEKEKAEREQKRREQEAKNLRISEDSAYFAALLDKARVKHSLLVELAAAFPPVPSTHTLEEGGLSLPHEAPKDDGYFAVIGTNNNMWDFSQFRQTGNGTWRNGSSIQCITHIGICGYQLDKNGQMDRMSATLLNGTALFPTVRVFDCDDKQQYASIEELKADIADVLSKIYGLPNPLKQR